LTGSGQKTIKENVKRSRWTAAGIAALFVLWAGYGGNGDRISRRVQKGISYAAWGRGLYSLPQSDISLAQLAETGANWIGLIVTCYQDNIGSTSIFATEQTPIDTDLIHALNRAHSLGLRVMLKPHLDLWRDPSHWRGEIGLDFDSEQIWVEWFSSYRGFIEHYAALAEKNSADQFCVGTELVGTSHRASDWRSVVAGIRSRYSGPLVYAANHSGEEISLTWWDAVDIIGVDAYYPLASETNPSLRGLMAAWKPRLEQLAGLAAKWQKRLILTEIGYRSLDGAASQPWNWQISGEVDLGEQAACYRAALEAFSPQPWFRGIFWWSWGPDPLEGGPADNGYSPHGKPAEGILRSWFEVILRRGGPNRDKRK
jgi:hypothetical protein